MAPPRRRGGAEVHLIDVDRPVGAIVDHICALVSDPRRQTDQPTVDHEEPEPAPERWVRLSMRTHQ